MAEGKASIEMLVERTFQSRNAAHRVHWKTKSFAEHMALGDFYDRIVDQIDGIVEDYQGGKGLIKTDADTAGLVYHLTAEAKWIEDNREAIANGSASVLNKLDDLVGSYRTTLYKLKHLD